MLKHQATFRRFSKTDQRLCRQETNSISSLQITQPGPFPKMYLDMRYLLLTKLFSCLSFDTCWSTWQYLCILDMFCSLNQTSQNSVLRKSIQGSYLKISKTQSILFSKMTFPNGVIISHNEKKNVFRSCSIWKSLSRLFWKAY